MVARLIIEPSTPFLLREYCFLLRMVFSLLALVQAIAGGAGQGEVVAKLQRIWIWEAREGAAAVGVPTQERDCRGDRIDAVGVVSIPHRVGELN